MEPAAIRYKNPGAMWGRAGKRPSGGKVVATNAPIPLKWGSTQTVYLSDGTGQGNNIAVFDTWVQGISAQLDLWRTSPRYRNKRFADAIHTWSGGNNVPSYIAYLKKRVPGLTEETIMNDAFWRSSAGIAFLKAQAAHEAGKKIPAPNQDWIEAQRIVFAGAPPKTKAAPVAPSPSIETAPAPVAVQRPGIFGTIWNLIRGKDAAVETKTAKVRPGLHPEGDPSLWDQQDLLSSKGYTEVGQPDGLMGPKTINAIRAFRAENGLPKGDAIDAKFAAALAAAGPRRVAKTRADASASDLRENGNSQVAALDGFGWIGKLLLGGGILGGAEQQGLLTKASDTLSSAQDALGTVTTILTTIIGVAQWCFAHWWLFAAAGGLYMLFKVAMAVLNMVVMFRQGFLARADK